jgi:hypothetical protein
MVNLFILLLLAVTLCYWALRFEPTVSKWQRTAAAWTRRPKAGPPKGVVAKASS